MTKLISILCAVVLTPTYTAGPTYSLEEETNMTYYATYHYDDHFDWEWRHDTNENPLFGISVCSVDIHTVDVANYYSLIEGTITFNPEMVSKFGACAVEIKYGNSQILSSCFAVSYFANNQFNFGYNNRFNATWTRSAVVSGPILDFSLENDDIEQASFTMNFYAYQRNKDLLYQDYYDAGYDAGYDTGYDVGINDNGFTLDWLTEGVAGFLDVDIFGTFGIGDILLLFLGAFLMIYLLKVFAGG